MSILVTALLGTALFFFAVGTIGVLRFPDFYTRLHAAGKCDTLSAILALTALALFNLQEFSIGNLLVSLKIMAIAAFIFVASPTASHALTEAALILGVKPWEKKEKS